MTAWGVSLPATMNRASPVLFYLALSLLAGAVSSCSMITAEQATLDKGIFVFNSRDVSKKSVIEISEGNRLPAGTVGFGDLERHPELRFRGRLTKVGGKALAGDRVGVQNVQSLSYESFHARGEEKRALVEQGVLAADQQTFGEAVSDAQSLLIYVHGFNNSAADAAKFTLVLEGFLAEQEHEPVMMFYTWPTAKDMPKVALGGIMSRMSLGAVDGPLNEIYLGDRKNIDLAAHSLSLLYQELSDKYPNLKVDIIAHSMGTEVVMKSMFNWHNNCMVNGRSADQIQILRRVVLVGADVGLDTFRILAKPGEFVAEDILVYVNPRDAVLSQSADINAQKRVGAAELDKALPDISRQYTFLKLRDPIPVKPVDVARGLLVNHNPIRDSRIMRHACRFVSNGQITEDTAELQIEQINGNEFRGSDAQYFSVSFKSGSFVDALSESVAKPIRGVPVVLEGMMQGPPREGETPPAP